MDGVTLAAYVVGPSAPEPPLASDTLQPSSIERRPWHHGGPSLPTHWRPEPGPGVESEIAQA